MKLPRELCSEIAGLLKVRYGPHLREGEIFAVDGKIEPDEIEVTISLETGATDERVEVTALAASREADENPEELLSFTLDAADAFVGEWLEGGRDERHPIDFLEYAYEGRPVLMRSRRRRPELEEAADDILRAHQKGSTEEGPE